MSDYLRLVEDARTALLSDLQFAKARVDASGLAARALVAEHEKLLIPAVRRGVRVRLLVEDPDYFGSAEGDRVRRSEAAEWVVRALHELRAVIDPALEIRLHPPPEAPSLLRVDDRLYVELFGALPSGRDSPTAVIQRTENARVFQTLDREFEVLWAAGRALERDDPIASWAVIRRRAAALRHDPDPRAFEQLAAQVFALLPGLEERAAGGADKGFDLLLWNEATDPRLADRGNPWLVECKAGPTQFDRRTLGRLLAAARSFGVRTAVLFTDRQLRARDRELSARSFGDITLLLLTLDDIVAAPTPNDASSKLLRPLEPAEPNDVGS